MADHTTTASSCTLTIKDLERAMDVVRALSWPRLKLLCASLTDAHLFLGRMGVQLYQDKSLLVDSFYGIPIQVSDILQEGYVRLVVEHEDKPPEVHTFKVRGD